MRNFARATLAERRTFLVGIECVGRSRKSPERPDCLAHGKPGAKHQQHHLDSKHIGQPCRNRHRRPRRDVDRQRTSVTQRQMRLQPADIARNGFHADRIGAADRLFDPAADFPALAGIVGHTGQTRPKFETIVAAAETIEQVAALIRRQAVENGDRGRDITFQRAEHDGLGRHGTLNEEDCEGQAIGNRQARQQNEEKTSPQRARPKPGAKSSPHAHDLASSISTGTEKT